MSKIREDLTGKQFGAWIVLEDTEQVTKDRDRYWLCQCECGKIKKVRGSSLKKGTSKSCGCIRKDTYKDITGQRFNRLVALSTYKKENGKRVWLCKCDCGNTCERSLANLQRTDEFHSCGCYQIEKLIETQFQDLTGQQFGKLTIIKQTDKRTNGGAVIWECQCECGNTTFVDTHSLKSGNTSSCGCINYSIGEKNIAKILKENNINYKAQYTNNELKLKKFDFAILNNNQNIIRLIEFDGQQHFNGTKGMWNSTETAEDIQKRDQEKNQWAKEHNIPLVRIPYIQRDHVTLDMLLSDKYLVKGDA